MHSRTLVCTVVAALQLAGCAGIGPDGSLRSQDRLTVYGANPQFDNEKFEMVDLITLLNPDHLLPTDVAPRALATPSNAKDAQDADEVARTYLEYAFVAFYRPQYNLLGSVVERRTRVQDRLIAASNQRCEAYKIYLRRFEAYQDTTFGIATTVLAGAAAVVGGLHDAKILGGLAGIASGTRAELRQGLFGNLASYIIVPGIDQRRKEILAEMRSHGNDSSYTVQAAISDVARYHGACTMEAGMEQAKNAIQTIDNPGIAMVGRTLNSVMQTRLMAATLQKAGGPEKLTDEDLRIPSFTVDGVSLGARMAIASGSAVSIELPSGSSIEVVRNTSTLALGLIGQLLQQSKAQSAVLAAEAAASAPSVPKETLTDSIAKLVLIDAALVTQQTAVTQAAATSLQNAAAGDGCAQSLELGVSFGSAADKAAAQNKRDIYLTRLRAYIQPRAQLQNIGIGYSNQLVGDMLKKYSLDSLKASGGKKVDPPPDITTATTGHFTALTTPPSCTHPDI